MMRNIDQYTKTGVNPCAREGYTWVNPCAREGYTWVNCKIIHDVKK